MTAIALRPDLNMTLGSLRQDKQQVFGSLNHRDTVTDKIRVHADAADPTITLDEGVEVPLSSQGLEALADHLQVPGPFFKRIGQMGTERQADLLTMLLDNGGNDPVRVEYTDGGLISLGSPQAQRINSLQVLDTVRRVIDSDEAPIQRLVDSSAEFSFDVHVPLHSSRGVGGDRGASVEMPEALTTYSWTTGAEVTNLSEVGDITAAGLRVELDIKRGLSPSVQPWMMRLACTNGMETTTRMTRMDIRGMTVEEVLAEMEEKAELAFSRVEREIEHFYDLRERRISGDVETWLRATAAERGISDRNLVRMMAMAPEVLGSNPSEFDAINLITNFANRPDVRHGARLGLERAGGTVVTDEALRCSQCQHTLLN